MKKSVSITIRISLCMLVTLASSIVLAKSKLVSPVSIKGTTIVNAEQLIELAGVSPDMVIIDSRLAADRKQGYIEDSVSLPNLDTNCESLTKAIPDLTSSSLFYCNGIKCGRSAQAINIALGCGYTNLYWFRGGFEEWLSKGYSVVDAR
jgi:rhodanese-related sulfurtransferase